MPSKSRKYDDRHPTSRGEARPMRWCATGPWVLAVTLFGMMGCGPKIDEFQPDDSVVASQAFALTSARVDTANYWHHYERDSIPPTPALPCGQTAYMVARHMISPGFPVSKDELLKIHNRLMGFSAYKSDPNHYASVDQLGALAQADLGYNAAGYIVYRDDQRSSAKSLILSTLQRNRPVVVPVEYNFTQGNLGHFIVITGLDLTDSGVGSVVYYKDVFDPNMNWGNVWSWSQTNQRWQWNYVPQGITRTVDYTKMLDSMLRNSKFHAFNIVFFR